MNILKNKTKLVIVVETFARNMGYINNVLPKFLPKDNYDVHVITTDLSPYFQISDSKILFGESFSNSNSNQPETTEFIDGYKLHVLKNRFRFGYPFHVGLYDLIKDIKPEIVCIFQAAGWLPIRMAFHASSLNYKLVIGSHMGKTVFELCGTTNIRWLTRLRSYILRAIPGYYIGKKAHHCVVPTIDCAEVAERYMKIPSKKTIVMNLPVDTEIFYPAQCDKAIFNKINLRASLNISNTDFLCIYTGKFTAEKNVLFIANAISKLRSTGLSIWGLFIGNGEQSNQLRDVEGTIVLPFMPVDQLGDYYRASDIGIWMNETVSFLDAACCGLPLLLSNIVKDTSHLSEFSLIYDAASQQSLEHCIKLLTDDARRLELSSLAGKLGRERFGATQYAAKRSYLFDLALNSNSDIQRSPG